MMDRIKTQIAEDNDASVLVTKLDGHTQTLDTMASGWDENLIEEFKTEQLMPGCQLKLF